MNLSLQIPHELDKRKKRLHLFLQFLRLRGIEGRDEWALKIFSRNFIPVKRKDYVCGRPVLDPVFDDWKSLLKEDH